MKRLLFCLLLQLSFSISIAQNITPDDIQLKHFSVETEELGEVNYYATTTEIDSKKPILLYLDGSGAFPLFQKTKNGIGSSVLIDFRSLAKKYHVLLISKPGVPFFDSVQFDSRNGQPKYQHPQEYKDRLSLDWRVNSAKEVLNNFQKNVQVDTSKIAVFGISEGFQVACKLASSDSTITHLIASMGNGLNQLYDFIVQNRRDAEIGKISHEEAQKNIDSLLVIAEEIYESPNATSKEWYGHTYKRWSSFTENNPTENILSLSIPVYIIAGSKDRNTSVLSTDYLYLESIRQKKNNITYIVYPIDHSFISYELDSDGKVISTKNHRKKIIDEALKWLEEN